MGTPGLCLALCSLGTNRSVISTRAVEGSSEGPWLHPQLQQCALHVGRVRIARRCNPAPCFAFPVEADPKAEEMALTETAQSDESRSDSGVGAAFPSSPPAKLHLDTAATDKPWGSISPPEAPIILSPPQTLSPDVYTLLWRSGRDGGLPINAYFVKYRKVTSLHAALHGGHRLGFVTGQQLLQCWCEWEGERGRHRVRWSRAAVCCGLRAVCSWMAAAGSVLLCLDLRGVGSRVSSVTVSLWLWGIGLQGTLHSASMALKVRSCEPAWMGFAMAALRSEGKLSVSLTHQRDCIPRGNTLHPILD